MKKEKQAAKQAPGKAEIKPDVIQSKRVYAFRFYALLLSGAVSVVGAALFVLYFFSLNMVMGAPGIIMGVTGIFAFVHYWKKEGTVTTRHLRLDGDIVSPQECNCLNIYDGRMLFENMSKPEGFPWEVVELKSEYYVNIWDVGKKRLVPFVLPDQQYIDPIIFAERVLGLPAHRKVFERKPKLLQKLKTAMLVFAIGIVWLLILTTTGQGAQ